MPDSAKPCRLVFDFPNEASAREFAMWLCESGEQGYWEWMDAADPDDGAKVTFEYHAPQDKKYSADDKRRYENATFCPAVNGVITIPTEPVK